MSGKSNPTTRRLAASIVKFLQDAQKNGTLDSEDAESMEVAVTIISESFGLDTTPAEPANLLQVFDLYEKTREKMKAEGSGPSNESKAAEAERLKGLGNSAVSKKDYVAAIDHYTQALGLVPDNKIYLSNRAAAYSQSGQHGLAAADALKAVEIDPGYAKAWSRLGHARYALGDAKGSMEAYQKGLNCEGGQTDVMNRGYQTASKKYREQNQESTGDATRDTPSNASPSAASGLPDLSSLASMFGGGAGAGRGAGMPDLQGLMNNPMLMNMASQMAQTGAFDSIMNNPRMREMAQQMMSGERNLGDMMNDPEVQNMARNLGRGGGAGDGAGGAGGNTES